METQKYRKEIEGEKKKRKGKESINNNTVNKVTK